MSTTLPYKSSYPKAIWFIFGNEFCERFSYHGLKCILVLFFVTVQKYDHDTSTVIYHVFMICAYIAPFFGAIAADSYWGKYKAIFILSVVHAIGNIIVAVASFITSISLGFQRSFTIAGLLLTAIGAGGIKPCISAFGGDQFELPDQENQLSKFFSMFYFAVNTGSLVSTFVTPELRKSVQCFGEDSCFPLAFGTPAVLMLISIVLFVFGKSLYKIKKPTASIITSSIRCIFRAIINKITSSADACSCDVCDAKKKDWLEYAGDKYSKREISELRSALDVMYLFIPLPVFYMLYDQQGSRWTLQGTLMNGRIDFLNWTMKPDQIHMLNPLFVMIFLPLFDTVVYPILYKIGINTSLRKVTLGGLFASLAFVCTATVQYTIFGQSLLALSTNEGNILRIYNGLGCKVTLSDPSLGNNFTVQSLDALDINYYGLVSNKTGFLSVHVDPMCEQKITNTLTFILFDINQRVSIAQEKVISSYVLQSITTSNGDGNVQLERLQELKKLKNGNPNLRFLYDEKSTGRYITLRNVNNKLSEINFRLSPNAQDRSYEIPVGTYDLFVDGEYVSQTVDLLPASVNDLLLRSDDKPHVDNRAKLITTEKGKYIHILWQVPQTLFISIAEVMFVVTLLNFSFTQAPSSMKSIISAFNLFNQGVGNMLIIIAAKMNLFENLGHEFLFYAILMVLSMLVFTLMSAKYKYKSATDDRDDR